VFSSFDLLPYLFIILIVLISASYISFIYSEILLGEILLLAGFILFLVVVWRNRMFEERTRRMFFAIPPLFFYILMHLSLFPVNLIHREPS